jgi:DNA-binding CsgD family transcriptional regulator
MVTYGYTYHAMGSGGTMATFRRTIETVDGAASPVEVFTAEFTEDGKDVIVTTHLWPNTDGTYTIIQGQDGTMGGGKTFRGPRQARAEFYARIAEQIRYRSRPGQTFTSGEVQRMTGLSRHNLSILRKRGHLPVGKRTGAGYAYTVTDIYRLLTRSSLNTKRPAGNVTTVQRAMGNLYLRSLLTDKQRKVIELRYPEPPDKPLSLDEVAERLGITRQRVHQHERNALHKLEARRVDNHLT